MFAVMIHSCPAPTTSIHIPCFTFVSLLPNQDLEFKGLLDRKKENVREFEVDSLLGNAFGPGPHIPASEASAPTWRKWQGGNINNYAGMLNIEATPLT